MLMGLGLLALGVALLCYVVTAREPTPDSNQARALGPNSRPNPPRQAMAGGLRAAAESASLSDDTQVLRVRAAAFEGAQVDPPRAAELVPPASENPPLCAEPSVLVSYEAEAEEEEATSPYARILVTASGDTDRGQRRRANDDSLLVMPEHSLFAVADGMGGYAGGSVASRLAVETMERAFNDSSFPADVQGKAPLPRRGRELASAMMQAHQVVASTARATPEYCKMGTTLVAARFSPNKQRVYVGNVGDSRCYRFRGGRLRQLTTDQTMSTIGLQGPHAGDLLQAIGVTPDLAIDLLIDKPQSGDIYLLCSDGLNKMVSDRLMERVLAEESDLEAAVYGLIESANDGGGRDNITVVLVQVLDRPINDLATIPSPPAKERGWSKLPEQASGDTCGFDDVTVVGALPQDELTMLRVGLAPSKTRS